MPRSFKEFQQASAQWWDNRQNLLSSIGFSGSEDAERSVTYKWSSPNPYWEEIRQESASFHHFNLSTVNLNKVNIVALGDRVCALADAEEVKENALLKRVIQDIDVTTLPPE